METTEQKTEWRHSPRYAEGGVYLCTRIVAADTTIDVMTGVKYWDREIAERITRAVNSHNDLLAACEAALKLPTVHDSATCTDSTPCPACKRRESIRTAIAKATK